MRLTRIRTTAVDAKDMSSEAVPENWFVAVWSNEDPEVAE
jgi:hypothetical protein